MFYVLCFIFYMLFSVLFISFHGCPRLDGLALDIGLAWSERWHIVIVMEHT